MLARYRAPKWAAAEELPYAIHHSTHQASSPSQLNHKRAQSQKKTQKGLEPGRWYCCHSSSMISNLPISAQILPLLLNQCHHRLTHMPPRFAPKLASMLLTLARTSNRSKLHATLHSALRAPSFLKMPVAEASSFSPPSACACSGTYGVFTTRTCTLRELIQIQTCKMGIASGPGLTWCSDRSTLHAGLPAAHLLCIVLHLHNGTSDDENPDQAAWVPGS